MITIPAIDLKDGHVVRLQQGDPSEVTVYGDDPVAVAKRFEAEGAQVIHVVDLDGALPHRKGDDNNKSMIAEICGAVSVAVQTGGGLRTMAAIEAMLETGAARVVVGTAATLEPGFVDELVSNVGEKLVVALDVKRRHVMTHGWTQNVGPVDELMVRLAGQGVPRFMLTQISVDGMLAGPDLNLYRHTRTLTAAPIIASGGVGSRLDLEQLAETGVEAAIVGKAIYEGAIDLRDVVSL